MKYLKEGTPVMVKYQGRWSKGYVNQVPNIHGAQGEEYTIEICRLYDFGPYRNVPQKYVRTRKGLLKEVI